MIKFDSTGQAEDSISRMNNGYIPINVHMSEKVRLHFDDTEVLARTFFGSFVAHTSRVSRENESFLEFLGRCGQAALIELELPLQVSVDLNAMGTIQVCLEPNPFLNARIPSDLMH
jgi:hypothetical protein